MTPERREEQRRKGRLKGWEKRGWNGMEGKKNGPVEMPADADGG